MKAFIVSSWEAIMDNRKNPLHHLDLATQHYFMQVLGWMWSMVFSLSFLSIFQFGYTWLAHFLVIAGICMTVAVFKEAEKQAGQPACDRAEFSGASRCVWKLDSEA